MNKEISATVDLPKKDGEIELASCVLSGRSYVHFTGTQPTDNTPNEIKFGLIAW